MQEQSQEQKKPTLCLSRKDSVLLDRSLTDYRHLTRLLVHHNRLEQLPKDIGQLSLLKQLHAHHNNLQVLPKQISYLVQLQELYLGNNQLQNLPKEIASLQQLQKMHVYNNQLHLIPTFMVELTSLKSLRFDANLQAMCSKVATQLKGNRDIKLVWETFDQ